MSKSKLEQAFQLFVGNDELRPTFHNVFKQDGYVYATDANVLIRCKESYYPTIVVENPEFKNDMSEVIPFKNQNKRLYISGSMFDKLKTEDEYTFEGENKDCESCEGEGEVTWEFEHYSDEFTCPVCKGSGYSEEKKGVKTGNKTFGNWTKVKLETSYFRASLFYVLIEAQKILGGDIYLISHTNETRASLFRIGVCEILVMPILVSYDDREDFENTLTIDAI